MTDFPVPPIEPIEGGSEPDPTSRVRSGEWTLLAVVVVVAIFALVFG